MLSLWRLCGRDPCHRARCCRGNGMTCFRENFPLLPEGVRAWFEGLAQAQEQGWPFDEATDWLDSTPAGDAFRDWCTVVEKSTQGPR